jgi:hypothetical protein
LGALGLEEYDQLKGIKWDWQSLDGAMVKASVVATLFNQAKFELG